MPQDDAALNYVLKLTYVPRPIVGAKLCERGVRDLWFGPIHASGALPDEMSGKRRDVFRALAQGGNLDPKNSQTIVEILAETARVYLLRQVAIGRRDDSDVDLASMCVTDALQLLLLQYPQ